MHGTEESPLDQLRSSARRVGALTKEDAGWFGRLLQDRLARASRSRRDWDRVYPGVSTAERERRRIASACRKASLGAGLSATGAQLVGLGIGLGVAGSGLVVPVGVPSAVALVGGQTVYAATVQVDLACDLASIHGVPFDLCDSGEVATVFDIALRRPRRRKHPRWRSDLLRIVAPHDAELLKRISRHLATQAAFGLVPFLGIPSAAAGEYYDTRRLGRSACEYIRRRRAVRAVLGATLSRTAADKATLLEGAWLLATADDVLTHEGLLVLAALARMIPPQQRAPLQKLRSVGEAVWIVHMALLADEVSSEVLRLLEDIAGLLGPLVPAERSFLTRTAEALGMRVDFARIEHLHAKIARGEVRDAGR
jgi:hypothetical protein